MAGFTRMSARWEPQPGDAEFGEADLSDVDQGAVREAEALARLGNQSIEQVIQAGHEAALRLLVAKAQAGRITHQELAILRNMLRDNGMTLGVPPKGTSEADLGPAPDLPELPDYPGH